MAKSYTRLIIVVVLALGVFALVQVQQHKTGLALPSTYELPGQFGQWQGRDINSSNEQWMDELGADSMVFRSYHNEGTIISLYAAYYTDMDSADLVHAPTVCYPGQGWRVRHDSIIAFPVGSFDFRANRLIIEKQKQAQVVYVWWQTPEKILARNSTHRLYQLLSSLMFANSASVWVRLSIDVNNESMVDQEQRLQEFIHELVPLVQRYFPAE